MTNEGARQATSRERVLNLLQRKAAYNFEICDPAVGGTEGMRRVRELRAAGYPISKEKMAPGRYLYSLAKVA